MTGGIKAKRVEKIDYLDNIYITRDDSDQKITGECAQLPVRISSVDSLLLSATVFLQGNNLEVKITIAIGILTTT